MRKTTIVEKAIMTVICVIALYHFVNEVVAGIMQIVNR